MIDYDMFERLHPSNAIFEWSSEHVFPPDLMKIDEPPEEFLYCLPPEIHGFDFTSKTWSQCFRRGEIM